MRRASVVAACVAALLIATLAVAEASSSTPYHYVGQLRSETSLNTVAVKNLRLVGEGDKRLSFDNWCDGYGGDLKALAEDGKNLLVRYKPDPSLDPSADACPAGAIFFVSKRDFREMSLLWPKKNQTKPEDMVAHERAHIRRLLDGVR